METVYQGRERIDGTNAPEVQKEIEALIEGGATDVVVDLNETKYISSAGLRVLLSAHKKLKAKDGSFALKGVSATLKEILDVTGFSGFLTIID
ncbi:MAG: STAS domain-containing protein [Lachnospiraceae bacterium]|nr:STAS domain-containing protein [Lachnospiraceae bacterium]